MIYIKIMTIVACVITVFFSYGEYKQGKMSVRKFKIICICESILIIGMILLILV